MGQPHAAKGTPPKQFSKNLAVKKKNQNLPELIQTLAFS
jgi:hypothetical protein